MKKLFLLLSLILVATFISAEMKVLTWDDSTPFPFGEQWFDKTPIGSITMWGATNPPTGWLLCDGTAISRTTYSNLFNIIGTTYGVGNGSTTFNTPNLVQRFPLGADDELGVTGGYESVTLIKAQIPAHSHKLYSSENYAYSFGSHYRDVGMPYQGTLSSYSTETVGGGESHSNMPPYITVNYIIKHADVFYSYSTQSLPIDGSVPMTGELEVPSVKVTGGSPTNGAVFMATNEIGQGTWTIYPKLEAINTSAYVLAATWNQLTFPTLVNQLGGTWDGTNWTPGIVGYVNFNIYGNSVTASQKAIALYKNGVSFIAPPLGPTSEAWSGNATFYNNLATNKYAIYAFSTVIVTNSASIPTRFTCTVIP